MMKSTAFGGGVDIAFSLGFQNIRLQIYMVIKETSVTNVYEYHNIIQEGNAI